MGFSGALDGNLEMVFVEATQRSGGIDAATLASAIKELGLTRADVNVPNGAAAAFCARHGFAVIGRSEIDETGRPHPVLGGQV